MPVYTFKLRDGAGLIEDESGVILADLRHALDYAHDVVRELLKGRETETRSWRLDVFEAGSTQVFAIPFAALDDTLDVWQPEFRKTIEAHAERQLTLRETVREARNTVREERALVALSRGKPYLAAERGERTIR